jgi:hypothetical protein
MGQTDASAEIALEIAERFTNRRPGHHHGAMKMVFPEPERFGAMSRWSSAATPPEIEPREGRILEGCQC